MKKIITPLLLCLSLVSCARTPEYEEFFYAFGQAPIHIKTFEGTIENIQEFQGILNTFSKETDNYINSDVPGVYTINNTNDVVSVSDNLYKCLKKADELTSQLDSYFSIYLGSLSKIWKTALLNGVTPSQETIFSELTKSQETSLQFGENTVQRIGSSEIDLGAFAKGYALNLAKEYFKENQINQYIVDAGSSSIAVGQKNTEDGLFTIKIKDLTATYLRVKDTCISTSSISEQNTTINGKLYTHIINPETGEATVVNDTVLVLSDDGAIGDALSTSMMLMSVPEIVSIEKEFNVKALVVRDHKIEYKNKDITLCQ